MAEIKRGYPQIRLALPLNKIFFLKYIYIYIYMDLAFWLDVFPDSCPIGVSADLCPAGAP